MNKKDKKLLGRFESKKVRNKVIEGIDLPEDVPLFIKFVDRKYLSDFLQQGILHFGTLAEYRDMAQPGGVYGKADTIIGDLNEGVFHREYGEGTILDIDNKRTILEPHEYSTLRAVPFPNAAVFCFTEVPRSSLYSVGGGTFKIKKQLIDKLLQNFSYTEKVPVVLTGIGYIWEMVRLHTSKIRSSRGPIIYTYNQSLASNMAHRNFGVLVNSKDIIPFTKQSRYSHQYEYRFLLENNAPLDTFGNLKIGSLKGYAHSVNRLEDIRIQSIINYRMLTSSEIANGLKYRSFYELAMTAFSVKCSQGYIKVNA